MRSISLDKAVVLLAGLAVAVLPVLVNDHVISAKLGADIGTAVATYVVGYHTKQGGVFPAPADPAPEPVDAGATVADPADSGMGQTQGS
jgi:hypothetical protein